MTSFNNDNESLNEAYVRQCLGEDYADFKYEGKYITVEEFLKLQLDTGMIYEITGLRGTHILSATKYTNTQANWELLKKEIKDTTEEEDTPDWVKECEIEIDPFNLYLAGEEYGYFRFVLPSA